MNRKPISAAYLERKLRAITGLAGANPLPDLSDLTGYITLESDRPEWGFPASELPRSFFAFGAAGGAGILTVCGIDNLVNSGVLVIVERVDVWLSVAGFTNRVLAAWLNSGFLTLNGSGSRDGRDTLRQLTSVVGVGVAQQTPATFLANGLLDVDEFPQVGGGHHPGPYIIPPGRALVFYEADTLNARVLNTALTLGIAWRQRPLEGVVELK